MFDYGSGNERTNITYRGVAIFSILLVRALDGNERSLLVKVVGFVASEGVAVADGVELR